MLVNIEVADLIGLREVLGFAEILVAFIGFLYRPGRRLPKEIDLSILLAVSVALQIQVLERTLKGILDSRGVEGSARGSARLALLLSVATLALLMNVTGGPDSAQSFLSIVLSAALQRLLWIQLDKFHGL